MKEHSVEGGEQHARSADFPMTNIVPYTPGDDPQAKELLFLLLFFPLCPEHTSPNLQQIGRCVRETMLTGTLGALS